jgi:hypothetical protein
MTIFTEQVQLVLPFVQLRRFNAFPDYWNLKHFFVTDIGCNTISVTSGFGTFQTMMIPTAITAYSNTRWSLQAFALLPLDIRTQLPWDLATWHISVMSFWPPGSLQKPPTMGDSNGLKRTINFMGPLYRELVVFSNRL